MLPAAIRLGARSPKFTAVTKGTTETFSKLLLVLAPKRIFTNWFASAIIACMLLTPALPLSESIEPVLSSTRATSRPKFWRVTWLETLTVKVSIPTIAIREVGTVAAAETLITLLLSEKVIVGVVGVPSALDG